jgi:TetR/AcrR family transcriptional regulator, transcriptional repressor for nem operon
MNPPVRATPHRPRSNGTTESILDVAEKLVQTRGYNGFSYADIAAQLGITKAALHYHFASKGELGLALLDRYTERFVDALETADVGSSGAIAKLRAYGWLYIDVLRGGRMCLCGMLAAEYQTLPRPMQIAVRAFFDKNETWLTGVLEQGFDEGSLRFDGTPRQTAQIVVSDLEGAMLIARLHNDTARLEAAVERLLSALAP